MLRLPLDPEAPAPRRSCAGEKQDVHYAPRSPELPIAAAASCLCPCPRIGLSAAGSLNCTKATNERLCFESGAFLCSATEPAHSDASELHFALRVIARDCDASIGEIAKVRRCLAPRRSTLLKSRIGVRSIDRFCPAETLSDKRFT